MSEAATIMVAESNNPFNIFLCYASEDYDWYQKLYKQLSNLQRQNFINLWDESKISPRKEGEKERLKLLHNAHIILLFISPDFLASEDCYQDAEEVPIHQDKAILPMLSLLLLA